MIRLFARLDDHHRFPFVRWCAVALVIVACAGCGEGQRAENALPAEEQALMIRLTRDPFVIIDSWFRNEDGHLVVTTLQGAVHSRYIFKPDHPGERTLNIHHLEDESVLIEGEVDRRPAWTRSHR